MIRIPPRTRLRATQEAKAFLEGLKQEGVFRRSADGFALAAAFSMTLDEDVSSVSLARRADLVEADVLDNEVRLALEAGVHVLARRHGVAEPSKDSELVEEISRHAERGIQLLRTRWSGKTRAQIQDDIRKLVQPPTE